MPSKVMHYTVAQELLKRIPIRDPNRFVIGNICPDMSRHDDKSKGLTHFATIKAQKKAMDWCNFIKHYEREIHEDDLYLGILCHIITDCIWFHDITDPYIRAKFDDKEERKAQCIEGYKDFHCLNYILKNKYNLIYNIKEDREIDLVGLHPEMYSEIFDGLRWEIEQEPPAKKEDLKLYTYELTMPCLEKIINYCEQQLKLYFNDNTILDASEFYVPIR